MIINSSLPQYTYVDYACNLLINLRNTQGTIAKSEYLKSILDNELVMYLIKVLLDDSIVLGLKKIPDIGIHKEVTEVSSDELIKLIKTLESSNINDTLRGEVNKLLSRMSKDAQEVIQGILCKTYKIGVTAKSVNKIKKGYISEFSCMLADSGNPENYPCAVGLKYDGVRCLAFVKGRKVTLYTRQGNIISLPNIEVQVLRLAQGADRVFDGELISTSRVSVSGSINSIMKTGYTEAKGCDIHYKVFDVLPYDVFINKSKSDTQEARLLELSALFISTNYGAKCSVSEAIHTICYSEEQLQSIYDEYISLGEEGIISKDLRAPYEFKRSKAWLKVKAINSCTLKVIGCTEGTNDRKGKIGAFICESEDCVVQVDVGSGLTDDDLNTITPESIIGKYVEVLFNVLCKSASTNTFSLFLPRLKKGDWLRLDKTKADSLQKIIKEHKGKPQI